MPGRGTLAVIFGETGGGGRWWFDHGAIEMGRAFAAGRSKGWERGIKDNVEGSEIDSSAIWFPDRKFMDNVRSRGIFGGERQGRDRGKRE